MNAPNPDRAEHAPDRAATGAEEHAFPRPDAQPAAAADPPAPSPARPARQLVRGPAGAPCNQCPYRRDVPSGVWARREYEALVDYDAPMAAQPIQLFICHEVTDRVCAGWVGCHGGEQLLALRVAAASGWMLPSQFEACVRHEPTTALFGSGTQAAQHGMAEIDTPGEAARQAVARLIPKIARRGLDSAVALLEAPEHPADGDCLIFAPVAARQLTAWGYPARTLTVAGYLDPHQHLLAFAHQTVLVPDPHGDTDRDLVVDLTARQFDPNLPARWQLPLPEYLQALAAATSVALVRTWGDHPEPG